MANFSDAISPEQNLGGAVSFPVGYQIEEAGQTFVLGTPVQVKAADGGLQAWDGATVAAGIAGVTMENANNLGSTGSGAPVGFSPILGPGSVVGNYSANPNQPLAVITPPMTPMSDGRLRFWIAAPGTVFIAKIGTTGSAPIATAQTQVGVQYGLTKDSGNNYWYVDTSKTGGSAVLAVVALSPLEPVGTVGGHVLFVFLNSAAQIFA
jgi:hypothetical protein